MKNNMAMSRQTYGRACKKKKKKAQYRSQSFLTFVRSTENPSSLSFDLTLFCKSYSPHWTSTLVSLISRWSPKSSAWHGRSTHAAIYHAKRSRGTFVLIKLQPFNTLQTPSIFTGRKSAPCWHETHGELPRLPLTPLQWNPAYPWQFRKPSAVHPLPLCIPYFRFSFHRLSQNLKNKKNTEYGMCFPSLCRSVVAPWRTEQRSTVGCGWCSPAAAAWWDEPLGRASGSSGWSSCPGRGKTNRSAIDMYNATKEKDEFRKIILGEKQKVSILVESY